MSRTAKLKFIKTHLARAQEYERLALVERQKAKELQESIPQEPVEEAPRAPAPFVGLLGVAVPAPIERSNELGNQKGFEPVPSFANVPLPGAK